MRKKLGKKVLSGKMTVDEARARMGRQFAQKGDGEPQEAVQKAATVPATYVAHGDPNATPGQIRELQEGLNKTAGANVIVLPPGSRTPDTPPPGRPRGHQGRRRRGHLRTEGPARQAAGNLHHQAR